VHLEDDHVEPNDGDEEEQEDAHEAVLHRDDRSLPTDEEEGETDDEGNDGRGEEFGIGEGGVAEVVLRHSFGEEDALAEDGGGGRRTRTLLLRALRTGRDETGVGRRRRAAEASELALDGLILRRRRPFVAEAVKVAHCVELLVRNVDAGLGDVEEEVGGVGVRRGWVRVVGGGGRKEVLDGTLARAEVDLFSSSLKEEDVVEFGKGFGGLSRGDVSIDGMKAIVKNSNTNGLMDSRTNSNAGLRDPLEQLNNPQRALRVESGRSFVGEEDSRLRDDLDGDRNSLALLARQSGAGNTDDCVLKVCEVEKSENVVDVGELVGVGDRGGLTKEGGEFEGFSDRGSLVCSRKGQNRAETEGEKSRMRGRRTVQVELLNVARRPVELSIRLGPVNTNRSSNDTDGPSSENVEYCLSERSAFVVERGQKRKEKKRTSRLSSTTRSEKSSNATGLDVPRYAIEQASSVERSVDPKRDIVPLLSRRKEKKGQ
jgi:hypothetical protein